MWTICGGICLVRSRYMDYKRWDLLSQVTICGLYTEGSVESGHDIWTINGGIC